MYVRALVFAILLCMYNAVPASAHHCQTVGDQQMCDTTRERVLSDLSESVALLSDVDRETLHGIFISWGNMPTRIFGVYHERENTLLLNHDMMGESPRAIAAVLAHELIHARQDEIGFKDCMTDEIEAHIYEAQVWRAIRQPYEPHSRLVRFLDNLVDVEQRGAMDPHIRAVYAGVC